MDRESPSQTPDTGLSVCFLFLSISAIFSFMIFPPCDPALVASANYGHSIAFLSST